MELLFHGGKQLNIIAYNDNESLDDADAYFKTNLRKVLHYYLIYQQ